MIYEIGIINADDVKWIANCLQSTTNGCYCAAALIVEMWLWLLRLCEVLIVDVSLRVWAWWPKVCEWYYVSHRRGSWYCLVSYGIAWYCGWCVSHRRGLRIWGLSSNNASGPRAPYQEWHRHGENLFLLSVCPTYYHQPAPQFYLRRCWRRANAFLLFPSHWTFSPWEQFWLVTLFSPDGRTHRTTFTQQVGIPPTKLQLLRNYYHVSKGETPPGFTFS